MDSDHGMIKDVLADQMVTFGFQNPSVGYLTEPADLIVKVVKP